MEQTFNGKKQNIVEWACNPYYYETYLSTDTDASWDAGHNNCGGGGV